MKPTAYHSVPSPFFSTRPASPSTDAAERYSPAIAIAFQPGETLREAIRKSDVLRAARTP